MDRTAPFRTPALEALAGKVRVRADARLDKHYPQAWPARVTVEQSGKRRSLLVTTPRGDARNPLGWRDVLGKAGRYNDALEAIRAAGWNDRMLLLEDMRLT